jgi:hypothetical protein
MEGRKEGPSFPSLFSLLSFRVLLSFLNAFPSFLNAVPSFLNAFPSFLPSFLPSLLPSLARSKSEVQ